MLNRRGLSDILSPVFLALTLLAVTGCPNTSGSLVPDVIMLPDDDDDTTPADDDDDSAPDDYEGDKPLECEDGADNDQDGLYDCNDPDCAGAPACQGDDDDSSTGDDDDSSGDDDDATPADDDDSSAGDDDDDVTPPDDDDSSGDDDDTTPGDDDSTPADDDDSTPGPVLGLLECELAPTPVSDTYVRGQTGIVTVGFDCSASESDVTMTDLTVHVVGDNDADFSVIDDDLIGNDHWFLCDLSDAGVDVSDSADDTLLNGNVSINPSGDLVFTGFSSIIPNGTTQTLHIVCTARTTMVVSGNDDVWLFSVEDATQVSAVNGTGDPIPDTQITLTDATSATGLNTSGSVAITLKNWGELTCALHPVLEPDAIVIPGETFVFHSEWECLALYEGIRVGSLPFHNCLTNVPDTDQDCLDAGETPGAAVSPNLTLSYTPTSGSPVITVPLSPTTTFSGLTMDVPRGGTAVFETQLTIVDDIPSGNPSGAQEQLNLKPNMFTFGLVSGDVIVPTQGYLVGNTQTARATFPTVAIASSSPSGSVSVSTPPIVLEYTMEAHPNSDLDYTLQTFQIDTLDQNGVWSFCNTLGDDPGLWNIYDTDDLLTPLDTDLDWSFTRADEGACTGFSAIAYATVDLSETIPAGTTKTYILEIDLAGAGASGFPGDWIAVSLPSEEDLALLMAFGWSDGFEAAIDGVGIDTLPATGNTLLLTP